MRYRMCPYGWQEMMAQDFVYKGATGNDGGKYGLKTRMGGRYRNKRKSRRLIKRLGRMIGRFEIRDQLFEMMEY